MGECVHEHRDAQSVGPQNELLAFVIRDVAGVGEDLDRRGPLVLRELDFRDKRVQVAYERLHDRAQPRVGASVEAGDSRRRDVRG